MLTALLEAMVTPLYEPGTLSPALVASLAFMSIVAVLCYFPPISSSVTIRFCYMLVEIGLVFLSSFFGVYRLFSLLLATIVAKGALMLPLRVMVVLMAFTACLHLMGSELHPTLFLNEASAAAGSWPSMLVTRFENEIFLICSLVLVGLMARTLISEQESRQQVEELAKEVETLATYQERARIAREIHDALGHTLTSLNIQLEVAKKLQERDPEKSKVALDSAKKLASQSLSDVRQALHMIMPTRQDMESFDINEAIPLLIRQVEQNQPIKVTLELGRIQLSSTKSHHLYCIVRECLTNIQRHASATQIGIGLRQERSDNSILVEIQDDGRGFNPEESGGGFGLSGMRQRVEFLGGSLAIQSTPGSGTKIRVSVPSA